MAPDTIIEIDPADVSVGDRLGFYWPEKAEAYGIAMARDGQNDPIKVTKNGPRAKLPYSLIVGLHRLRGAGIVGIKIKAVIVTGDDASLLLMQASENIHRRSLTALERASFVAAVAEVTKAQLKAKHGGKTQPEVAAAIRDGRAQYTSDEQADELSAIGWTTLSTRYSWKEDTAEALDLGPKTVQRFVRIYHGINAQFPDLLEQFKSHPVAHSADQMLDITKFRDIGMRRAIILELIGGAKTVEAAAIKAGAKTERDTKSSLPKSPVDRVFANLNRWTENDWTSAAPQIVSAVPKKAFDAICDAFLAERRARNGGAK